MTSPIKTRALAVAAAVAILGSTVAAGPALAHKGFGPKGSTTATEKVAKVADRLATFLAGLVKSGTITQAQADAIVAAKKSDIEARAAKMEQFRTEAKKLAATAHGYATVAEFDAAIAAKTVKPLTAEQRTALKAQMDALAQSLGLDHAPKGFGMGKGKGKRH